MDELPSPFPRALMLGDERLAGLVTEGSSRAYSTLYERYREPIYRYCRSILGHDADAHDVVQSTFTSALVALRHRRRDAPVRPWLFRIAHNEAIAVLRGRRALERLSGRLQRHAIETEDRVGDREQFGSLLADLRELPERQRGAILMRELGGLSHEEIAIALGGSASAARQAIFEARTTLSEFAEGRATPCQEIRRAISDHDRRVLRSRRVRAHLRDCAACAGFAADISARRGRLKAFAPPVAASGCTGLLGRLLHGGRAGSTGGLPGAANLLTAGGENAVGAAIATKLAIGAAFLAAAGAGVSVQGEPGGPRLAASSPSAFAESPDSAGGLNRAAGGVAAQPAGPGRADPRVPASVSVGRSSSASGLPRATANPAFSEPSPGFAGSPAAGGSTGTATSAATASAPIPGASEPRGTGTSQSDARSGSTGGPGRSSPTAGGTDPSPGAAPAAGHGAGGHHDLGGSAPPNSGGGPGIGGRHGIGGQHGSGGGDGAGGGAARGREPASTGPSDSLPGGPGSHAGAPSGVAPGRELGSPGGATSGAPSGSQTRRPSVQSPGRQGALIAGGGDLTGTAGSGTGRVPAVAPAPSQRASHQGRSG